MNQVQTEAITTADACTSAAGLPTYSELVDRLKLVKTNVDAVLGGFAGPQGFATNPETPPYID